MREWVLKLTKKERCLVHDYEYILGRRIRDGDEFREIMENAPPEYASMGRREFFRKFPDMRKYRVVS